MMVIEGADRFGLAQLHQLRGRVGRGSIESFCVLVSESTDEVAQARLKAVAETHDGFELAEKDFELRKEGDVLGLAQSGFPRLRVASLQIAEHRDLAVRARAHAEALLDADGRMVAAAPGADRRAGRRLAAARRGRRAGDRRMTSAARPWLTPGGSSPGTARGIRLDAPGAATRPIADRVKQTLFAILEPDLRGRPFLDLFAGSGAAGIEALSRGAAHATFVERDRAAAAVIAANLGRTRLGRPARADRPRRGPRAGSAARTRPTAGPFDVVGRRPAVRRDRAARRRALEALGPLLAPGARVVAKHFWRTLRRPPDRAASIRARAPLRRDDADLLSTRGGSMNTIAVYPGSFDPITNGHLDIVAAGVDGLRHGHRRRPRQPTEDAAAHASTSGSRSSARHSQPRPAAARPSRGRGVRRPDGRLRQAPRGTRDRPRPARHQRLRDRDAAGATTTGSSRRGWTPSSS